MFRYNIMTNLSKNIYAMINYKQRSTEIYEKSKGNVG
jgi:hypothetical protein